MGALGGLRQRAVVIAVPTGSGWVDAAAVRGFEERFAGSVRILAVQYSEVPSWQAYVRSPASAGESAIALLDAVVTTLRGHRPEVYLYGQSLGAIGADAARQWSAAHHHPLTGSVLVGYPGGHPAGVDPTRTVINNASDPVARLGFSLLWKPAASAAHQTENVPAPPWLPGLSALATVIDLFGSLDVPSGFGHRYGPEQAGESLPPALTGGTPDTATLDTAMPVP